MSCVEQRCCQGRIPHVGTAACNKGVVRWKVQRRSEGLRQKYGPAASLSNAPSCNKRGRSNEPFTWILAQLRTYGYAFIQLTNDERKLMDTLFTKSRDFFGKSNCYKESFKFYPVPGGYMTPYPGTYEIFELRRGLCRCPEELRGEAMNAFLLLERLSYQICEEIGRDIGTKFSCMVSDESPKLRCIHYDRPSENRGALDSPSAPSHPPCAGTKVRIVGLKGRNAQFNGLHTTVTASGNHDVEVSIQGAPMGVLESTNGSGSLRVPLQNLRGIDSDVPGVYSPHSDSSLITIAPKSSASGLEAKDLHSGEWFNIEDSMESNDCLVFVGDPLDYISSHAYPALMHRPVVPSFGGSEQQEKILRACHNQHRVSTPFFLYPRDEALLASNGLPRMTFGELNSNVGNCRDGFPWKLQSCYYSDLVYSETSRGASESKM